MKSRHNILLLLVLFWMAPMVSYAQSDIDYFRSWYNYPRTKNTDLADEQDAQQPQDDVEQDYEQQPEVDEPEEPAALTAADDSRNYTGYYEVDGQMYFYNEDSGKFVEVVDGSSSSKSKKKSTSSAKTRTASSSKPVGGSSYAPSRSSSSKYPKSSYSGSSSYASSSSARSGQLKPIVKYVGPAKICSIWQHGLAKKKVYTTRSTCQSELQAALEEALGSLQSERDNFDRQLAGNLEIPAFVTTATRIDRPALETSIRNVGERGCACAKNTI